jgi:hypothetical protein
MKTPNQLDDGLHVGLLAIALCLVVAVIADAQRPAAPVSAIASQPVPAATATAQHAAPLAPATPRQPA